jgi:glycerol-3-phosphate acyltransferase PlsY
LGYLWGSIPTARLIARLSTGKEDVLAGGNVGTLNTIRRVGLGPGLAVATLDIAKGAAAVLTARALNVDSGYVLFAGVMAVVGHNWMVWLGFKGGKGMAAATGANRRLRDSLRAPLGLGRLYRHHPGGVGGG